MFGGSQIGYLPHICCYSLSVWSILVLCFVHISTAVSSGTSYLMMVMVIQLCFLRMMMTAERRAGDGDHGNQLSARFKYGGESTCRNQLEGF